MGKILNDLGRFKLLRKSEIALVSIFSLQGMLAASDAFTNILRPAFRKSCVQCHGQKDKIKGDINLFELNSKDDLLKHPTLIQDLIDVLDFEEMPPEEKHLKERQRIAMIHHLQELLTSVVADSREFPATPIRRMNRFQYSNTVQDLFDLNVEVFALPERMLREHGNYFQPSTRRMPDQLQAGSRPLGKSQLIDKRLADVAPFPQDLRAEHGFDNRGDHLSLSPLLLESFLKLGRSIVESQDFNSSTCGIWEAFFIEPGWTENKEQGLQDHLGAFLSKAFRRPVEESVLNRYVTYAQEQIAEGTSFTDAMKEVASIALASPRFLYLYDRAAADQNSTTVTDFELASRLSFFLWGSIPDQELLDLANAGQLSDKATLSLQVDRMLADKKVKRFCDSFPSQWLQLERIISSVPDRDKFPDFYFANFRVSIHMMMEPLLLFETILLENRSILELIDSDYSYRSELLNAWYAGGELPNRKLPATVPFSRIPLADRREGGVITTAATMTMTSNPTRTQPITRGAWISSLIFNDPPEPPPAGVPPLEETSEQPGFANLPLREQFAAHRDREDCAGCHKRIDQLGFALENYGPTGKWRDLYENGFEVDSAGMLFKKHAFKDIVEFKDAILSEKDRFAKAFATHLLSFSLGRETGIADAPSISKIVEQTNDNEYTIHTLIKEIVLSESFSYKSVIKESAK